ncbi:aldo/keto reductase family oxidoreductase [uncultured Paracoccus sp.]|uniref:aldo/keto reductase n=1 Tax=uncultured Paracoccus sp. TaxID=189685 RepID=UPI0026220428|nr:aldo/keto reductase [uncultured Paracoccus sp.]
MERIDLPGGGVSLSRIVYGMWRLGDDADTSPALVQKKIEACLAQGITTMDHADIYGGGTGQTLLGAALRAAPELRQRIELVTKCGIVPPGRNGARVKHYDTSPAYIRASLEQSLRDLAVEQVDLLLIHRPDPMMDADATGAVLDQLVAEGKTRAVGVSNFRPWDVKLLQSRMTEPLSTNQIELSLLAHEPFEDGDLAFLMERRIPVMAWSPLGGGSLFASVRPELTTMLKDLAEREGTDMGAVALAWLLAHPARIMPVVGTNNLDRIAQAHQALSVRMDRQDWFALYQAALGRDVP